MRSARIRAIASDGPPAENGTMMVMGREGKFCADAAPAKASDRKHRQNELSHHELPHNAFHRRHCEERSDEAIHLRDEASMDCFARKCASQ